MHVYFGQLLVYGTVILIPILIVGLLLERRSERRFQRRPKKVGGNKNRTPTPDATPELSRFVSQLMPGDYKETSLVRSNGKYYGATFGSDQIVLRLPPDRHESAIAAGGQRSDRKDWITFHYDWGTSSPGKVDHQTISQWCRVARDFADRAK